MSCRVCLKLLPLLLVAGMSVRAQTFVQEPQKRVPVLYDVDVAVAGAGPSGIFAAIAAARTGASTVLIERFETVGGIYGPGLTTGGGVQGPGDVAFKSPIFTDLAALDHGTKKGEYLPVWVYPEIAGIPKEFAIRLAQIDPPRKDTLEISSAFTYLATRMLEEAGVRLLLSTWVADPIMDGNTIRGVFVENKSGRQAIKAKVVVDATGEADVARRAGAPFLKPVEEYYKIDGHSPNGMGLAARLGGIDWAKYEAALKQGGKREPSLPPASVAGKALAVVGTISRVPGSEDLASVSASLRAFHYREYPKAPKFPIGIDPGSGLDISVATTALRVRLFEYVQALRREVPGCEKAYIVVAAPYLGTRGGPCIEGEYTMTMADCVAARRFDDVIYLFGEARALQYTCIEQGKCAWPDVPYRVMVPKKIDGLLAVGRSASGKPDTLLRNRTAVQHMGQAGGTAAALAALQKIPPRRLNVRELQRKLLDAGFYLGDDARLRQLGLK